MRSFRAWNGKLERPLRLSRELLRDGLAAAPLEGILRNWSCPGSSIIDERGVVEIDCRKLILFSPVVLAVLPFRLVATLGQQMHVAHQIAGIEIFGIDP